jgi:hydrogenase-4 component F
MMAATGTLTLALALAPAIAIVLILLIRRPRAAEALNLAASAISLLAILLILTSRNDSGMTFWGSYIIIDGLGTWTILCAALVYFLASLYAVGYMRLLDQEGRLYRFYAMFAGFGLSILIGPMMNNAGLYWIAIELTTLISTFLVAFEREAESFDAAW